MGAESASDRILPDYIGDGVYVYLSPSSDRVLYLNDGIREFHEIVLEPQVVDSLRRWLDRCDEYVTRVRKEQEAESDG